MVIKVKQPDFLSADFINEHEGIYMGSPVVPQDVTKWLPALRLCENFLNTFFEFPKKRWFR